VTRTKVAEGGLDWLRPDGTRAPGGVVIGGPWRHGSQRVAIGGRPLPQTSPLNSLCDKRPDIVPCHACHHEANGRGLRRVRQRQLVPLSAQSTRRTRIEQTCASPKPSLRCPDGLPPDRNACQNRSREPHLQTRVQQGPMAIE